MLEFPARFLVLIGGNGIIPGYNDLYSYDALSRVTSASNGWDGNAYDFSYDPNGNRTLNHFYGWTDMEDLYTLNPGSNQLAGTQTAPDYRPVYPAHANTFDAAGNLSAMTFSNGFTPTVTITYGDNDRPRTWTTGTLLTSTFTHNGLGQRVTIANPTGSEADQFPDKTLFYDEAGHVIGELQPGGWATEYIYVDDMPVGFLAYSGTAGTGTGGGGTPTLYFFHTDPMNLPLYAFDPAGNLVWFLDNMDDPFSPLGAGGITPRLGFPGQYYLPETGMYYNDFRDYDFITGRYIQPDPIGLAGGLNPYSYVNNNPLRYSDPQGLRTLSVGVAGSFQYKGAGASGSFTFGGDTKGQFCFQIASCGRVGPGESAGVTGTVESDSGTFCEGDSGSGGFFGEGGEGAFDGFSLNGNSDNTSGSLDVKLRGGIGEGAAAGSQACVTRTFCVNPK